jgi:DNA-binding SARP family transcriptional activator
MLELQTYGTVGLRARETAESTALLVQPKRLALLVYLALAPRRRLRRREQILALFWPELDAEHARGSLSQALRYLRRGLSEEALVTRGEEEVGVDASVLWCDAPAFTEAVAAQDGERALSLYQGHFLDGFHVADAAPPFEQWVAGERTRFRDQAKAAATRLAERAERAGDGAGAVAWARRAADIAPEDEVVVARLIRLLAGSGDRAGALRTYDALRQRLWDEFRVAPPDPTRALLARILEQ